MGLVGRATALTDCQSVSVDCDDDDTQVCVFGYRRCVWRSCVCWLCVLLTGGLLALVLHWRSDWRLKCTHTRCPLTHATAVLVLERYKKHITRFVHRVMVDCVSSDENSSTSKRSLEKFYVPDVKAKGFSAVDEVRYFRHKRLNYLWVDECAEFVRVAPFFVDTPLDQIHKQECLTPEEQAGRRAVYGRNHIELHLTPLLKVALLEVLTPFYVFQVFSCLLWYVDEYVYYATAIVIASTVSVTTAVYQQRKSERNLRRTVQRCSTADVMRNTGEIQTVSATELAPGDVIVLPPHCWTVPCDAVLLTGTAIVNESMLTGESVPVTKVQLPCDSGDRYSATRHAKHTIYCGTELLQTRYYRYHKVLALVTSTGFLTSKGRLVRSILYPAPADIGLERDAYRFVAALAVIAVIGMLYSSVSKALRGRNVSQILLDVLDLITIVVPPALPFAVAVGTVIAIERLRRQRIFCISQRAVNLSGLVDVVCFDKTGTLTEDGLDLKCVLSGQRQGTPAAGDLQGASEAPLVEVDWRQHPHSPLTTCMACCHSLMIIDGLPTGDPLDLKMFEATGWTLLEPTEDETANYDVLAPTLVRPPPRAAGDSGDSVDSPLCSPTPDHSSRDSPSAVSCSPSTVQSDEAIGRDVGIMKQFVFDSALQRMSVLTRLLGEHSLVLFCKGAPEKLVSLCLPHTVPAAIWPTLSRYTASGYRVLALAYRRLQSRVTYVRAQRMSRDTLESELTFVGLLVFENRLKPSSCSVVADLTSAAIRSVMVTGDNMLTAVSVARECGIVPPTSPLYRLSPSSDPLSEQQLQLSPVGVSSAELEPPASHCWRLVLTGDDFGQLCSRDDGAVSETIVARGAVFARMSPQHKQRLVELIKTRGHHVAMCGDGANDCGALKAAHVGVSLSTAEASIASAFTAASEDVACVLTVIREGRAALVTAFGIFKYMAVYSLAQFVSVMLLYEIDCGLTDFQFLYIDLFLITVFAALFGMTGARRGRLSRKRPPTKLMSPATILSLVLQVLVLWLVQYSALVLVRRQSDFKAFQPNDDDDFASHENFAVYTVSSFQYCVLAVVFSAGPPHRRRLYTNLPLALALLVNTAFSLYLLLAPSPAVRDWFELLVPSSVMFRVVIMLLAILHCFLAFLVEFCVNHPRVVRLLSKVSRIRGKCRGWEVGKSGGVLAGPSCCLTASPRSSLLSSALSPTKQSPESAQTLTEHRLPGTVSSVFGSDAVNERTMVQSSQL